MSLFKKPKRNFRQRVVKFESDEEDGIGESNENKKKLTLNENAGMVDGVVGKPKLTQPQPSSFPHQSNDDNKISLTMPTAKIKKKKEKKSNPQSVLSFQDDEDDEEVFKVKKSSQSRRLAKMLERERKFKNKDKSKDDPDGQSKENLLADLKMEKQDSDYYGEYAEVIPLNSDDDEEEDEDDEKNSCTVKFRTILESGAIPDAAMIHAARKRRQMAREMGDFIPVDDTEQYQGNNSRLIRDDDNDRSDEDDDEEGRISFTVNTAARDREKVREAIMSANQPRTTESGDDEIDEELERWEQEQIRKGVSIPQIQSHPIKFQQQDQMQSQQENHYYTQSYYSSTTTTTTSLPSVTSVTSGISVPAGFGAADVMTPSTSIDDTLTEKPIVPPPDLLNHQVPTLEMVRIRLQERFLSLNEVHRTHEREMERVADYFESSKSRVLVLEKEEPALAAQFTFYQEMRGYVTDLVECLDEKIIQINALESAMINLLKQRSNRLISRRQQDVKDQAEEFSKISSSKTMTVDVLNRERTLAEDTAKMRRIAEREGRRSRRRRARETKLSDVKHYEGMSSDDEEMEADMTRFYAERDRIVRDSANIFEDVVEEFSSLTCIKSRFEEWRKRFSQSYNEAYIGLCLPKICGPLVRLQLIPWDPLTDGSSFEDMAWYETLMFFGFDETADLESLRGDCDVNLVPTVVERIILTRITEAIDNAWDPMSTSQTLKLVRLIKKLVDEYPSVSGGSKKLTTMLQIVVSRIKKTLDEDVYVPLFPKTLLENTSLGANAFFQRQFWSCVKLLHNILSWQGILSDVFLQQLALDSLLNRYVLLALQTWPGGFDADKAQMIASVLPRSWFSRLTGEKTLPQLEMFCRYLKTAAANLDKNVGFIVSTQGFPLTTKTDPKDPLKDIIKVLATIRAMDHALSLANQFSLKDLKSLITSV